nr:uncharacterized protein LOC105344449 isoform X5 [Crassostrea gigas]XP_034324501.1 uncharacterized protein LOC105344449 isoform X5 [Crassostrea gigas]XP_034324502.1 uncharacterized protein LOC105344449 isoform X5 [Crassostrea gigas]
MAGGSMLTLFHLVMIYHSASLPQWVYRVDSCPDPKNISQWIEASKKLNCYHNLTSNNPTEQERIYHCLPSSFLNETLEFCSRSVLINSGNCPVYSYEFGTSNTPISYNCTDFISGCPTVMFKSKEVYKFPMCLNLRPKLRCFEAEKNCLSNTTYSTGSSNCGKLATFLMYICLILLILVVLGINLYSLLCSNELTSEAKFSGPPLLQHLLYSKRENSKISFRGGKARDNMKYFEIATTNVEENDQENDKLLYMYSNESTPEVNLSDFPPLQPSLNLNWENIKINFCGGKARDNMKYFEIATTNVVENDQENDKLLSSNVLTSEAKSGDHSLLQHCLYSKWKNSKIICCGGNAREYLEYNELTTWNFVKRDKNKDRLLSSNVLTSEAKLGDPALLQLSFYSMHEHFKINSFGGNTRGCGIVW